MSRLHLNLLRISFSFICIWFHPENAPSALEIVCLHLLPLFSVTLLFKSQIAIRLCSFTFGGVLLRGDVNELCQLGLVTCDDICWYIFSLFLEQKVPQGFHYVLYSNTPHGCLKFVGDTAEPCHLYRSRRFRVYIFCSHLNKMNVLLWIALYLWRGLHLIKSARYKRIHLWHCFIAACNVL